MKAPSLKLARIIGIHLEGPFLNPSRCGALDAKTFIEPSEKSLRKLLQGFEDTVKMITVAPELKGALQLIKKISEVYHVRACLFKKHRFVLFATYTDNSVRELKVLHRRSEREVLQRDYYVSLCDHVNTISTFSWGFPNPDGLSFRREFPVLGRQ